MLQHPPRQASTQAPHSANQAASPTSPAALIYGLKTPPSGVCAWRRQTAVAPSGAGEASAHLAFDAGDAGSLLAVLQQLQPIEFIERAVVDLVANAAREDADAKGAAAAGLLQGHVDVL